MTKNRSKNHTQLQSPPSPPSLLSPPYQTDNLDWNSKQHSSHFIPISLSKSSFENSEGTQTTSYSVTSGGENSRGSFSNNQSYTSQSASPGFSQSTSPSSYISYTGNTSPGVSECSGESGSDINYQSPNSTSVIISGKHQEKINSEAHMKMNIGETSNMNGQVRHGDNNYNNYNNSISINCSNSQFTLPPPPPPPPPPAPPRSSTHSAHNEENKAHKIRESSNGPANHGLKSKNEEWQRWKGGWRKVKPQNKSSPKKLPLHQPQVGESNNGNVHGAETPRASNGLNRKQAQVAQENLDQNDFSDALSGHTPLNDDNGKQAHQSLQHGDEISREDDDISKNDIDRSSPNNFQGSESIFISKESAFPQFMDFPTSNFATQGFLSDSYPPEPSASFDEEYRGPDINGVFEQGTSGLGKQRGGRKGISVPGLRFHPTGSCASTDDEDFGQNEYMDNVHASSYKESKDNVGISVASGEELTPIDSPSRAGKNYQMQEKANARLYAMNASPQSVMDDATFASSSDARRKSKPKKGRRGKKHKYNICVISNSDNGSVAPSDFENSLVEDDERSNCHLKTRIHVGKISDKNKREENRDNLDGERQGVIGKFVNSRTLTVLHDLITGSVCYSGGREIMRKNNCITDRCADDDDEGVEVFSNRSQDEYDEYGEEISLDNEYDDDDDDEETYEECEYEESEDEEGSFVLSTRRQPQESFSVSSSAMYTTDDESYKTPQGVSSNVRYMPNDAVKTKHRRGRSPTSRHGYNSDHSVSSRGSRSVSTFNSEFSRAAKDVPMTSDADIDDLIIDKILNDEEVCESVDSSGQESQSIAESVLTKDHSAWMAMTSPASSPARSVAKNSENERESNVNSNDLSRNVWNTNGIAIPQKNATSSSVSYDDCVADGYFKKLLSIGIKLNIVHRDEKAVHIKKEGKLFIQIGTNAEGRHENPCLIWKDSAGQFSQLSPYDDPTSMNAIHVFDIRMIRYPDVSELKECPSLVARHCFFISLTNGTSILFEAIDSLHASRVLTSLQKIVAKLARSVMMGEDEWVVRMMKTAAKSGNANIEREAPKIMMESTKKMIQTSLQQQAYNVMRSPKDCS